MNSIRFGTGPVVDSAALRESRARAARELGEVLGASVELVATANYRDLLNRLGQGALDLGWLPPVLCVRAVAEGATLLLGCVRAEGKVYHGALFVRAASSLREASELQDKVVGWVDPDSCGGHLFPKLALTNAGFDPAALFSEEKMLGSHAAVVNAVARGQVDCGATYAQVGANGAIDAGWTHQAPTESMRLLLLSPPIPSDAICAARHTTRQMRDDVARTFGELHRTAEGARVLRELFAASRLEPALPRHYDSVRRAIAIAGTPISSTRFR